MWIARRGWTLHEMLITLGMLGLVMALASDASIQHLRFFGGVAEIVALRNQVQPAAAIIANTLWSASRPAGDIVEALDSAIEVHATLGSAVTCGSTIGRLTIPAPSSASGNTLAAFIHSPEVGDRIMAFVDDTVGGQWLALHVGSAPRSGGTCPLFQTVSATRTLAIREPLAIPEGALLRFTKPIRFSLYYAADRRWYLGAREWNGTKNRFNAIQPVAGPLRPYSSDPSTTGLLLEYRDSLGVVLPTPADPLAVAAVTIVVRGESRRPVRLGTTWGGLYADSSITTIALRNAR